MKETSMNEKNHFLLISQRADFGKNIPTATQLTVEVNSMESEQLITKITQTLKRPDGSEVRIVVEQAFGSGLTPSLGVYVLRRPTIADNWQLCKNRTAQGLAHYVGG
uniref:hypothetical protein n=1 Tax=Escherichia coli TaxID=562 RepID=UPI001F2D4148|nr:hypothetical protein [Escherichia coli]UGK56835.1 hypothetical protein [Escherichia coli]